MSHDTHFGNGFVSVISTYAVRTYVSMGLSIGNEYVPRNIRYVLKIPHTISRNNGNAETLKKNQFPDNVKSKYKTFACGASCVEARYKMKLNEAEILGDDDTHVSEINCNGKKRVVHLSERTSNENISVRKVCDKECSVLIFCVHEQQPQRCALIAGCVSRGACTRTPHRKTKIDRILSAELSHRFVLFHEESPMRYELQWTCIVHPSVFV